jgi:hypothetical protein
MSEQNERERLGRRRSEDSDEPDVEAHRLGRRAHEEAPDETKKDDDEPDVEAHRFRPAR